MWNVSSVMYHTMDYMVHGQQTVLHNPNTYEALEIWKKFSINIGKLSLPVKEKPSNEWCRALNPMDFMTKTMSID